MYSALALRSLYPTLLGESVNVNAYDSFNFVASKMITRRTNKIATAVSVFDI